MPCLYQFGFEGGRVPFGVTASGEYQAVSDTTTYTEYPYGTVDLMFVFDITTSACLDDIDACISGVRDLISRYSLLSSARFAVATVGQDGGKPYLNFYGWTDNTGQARSTGYFYASARAESSSDFEAMLRTVRIEAQGSPSTTDGLEIGSSWVHLVLIPFMYGRFEPGFKYWSQPNQKTPLAAVVPEPQTPRFYYRDGTTAPVDGRYTMYNPTVDASPVIWGFRYNSSSWPNTDDAKLYRSKISAYDGGDWYSETIFVTRNPSLWSAFSTVDISTTTVSRDIKTWALHHYACFVTDTSQVDSSNFFTQFLINKYGGVDSVSQRFLESSLGVNDIFGRKTQSVAGSALNGYVDISLDSVALAYFRYSVFQDGTSEAVNPITGSWTCAAMGGVSVTISKNLIDIDVDGVSCLHQEIPVIIQGMTYDITVAYTASYFELSIDGTSYRISTGDALPRPLLPLLTARLAGIGLIDNVSINSGDDRYARRLNGDYDGRGYDFNSVDNSIPDPVQCFSLPITTDVLKDATIGTTQGCNIAQNGYAVSHVGNVDYPWHSVSAINASAVLMRNGTGVIPVEFALQHGRYKRPLGLTARLSYTPVVSGGSTYYDESARKLSESFDVSDIATRLSTNELMPGMWVSFYSGVSDLNVDPEISSLSNEGVLASLSDIGSDNAAFYGIIKISTYIQCNHDGTKISTNAAASRLYIDNVLCQDLSLRTGFHKIDFVAYFDTVVPLVASSHDLVFSRVKTLDHYDPSLHGWIYLGSLSVGDQLQDISLNEGGALQWVIPDTAFSGVLDDTTFYCEVTVIATDTTPTEWYSFNQGTKVLSGIPTNADVGTYLVKITARDSTGLQVFQTFKIIINNVNTAPYVVSVPSPVAYEEHTSYFDLSPCVTDDDIIHGDTLSYALYQQALMDDSQLITDDYTFNLAADSTGDLRDTSLLVMSMLTSGMLHDNLAARYGSKFSTNVGFSYASGTWQSALMPIGNKAVQIYIGGNSYDTGSTTLDLVSAIANTTEYYGIILDTGGLLDAYNSALENDEFSQLVDDGKILYINGVEKNRDEIYYYNKIKTGLARMGLYIESGYAVIPDWINIDGSICTFSPAYNCLGVFPLVARVYDSYGLFVDMRFNLTVSPVEHPIVATQSSLSYAFYHGVYFTQLLPSCFSDLDASRGDTPRYSSIGMPSWMSMSGQRIYGNPPLDTVDNYTFTYVATDRSNNKAYVNVTLTAGALPYVIFSPADISMHYTESRSVDISGIFRYQGTLSYSVIYAVNGVEEARPDWITLSGSTLVINPLLASNSGNFSLTFVAMADDVGYSVNDSINVSVLNDSPYYAGVLHDTSVDYTTGSISYSLQDFVDPEARQLSYSYAGPAFLSLSGNVVSGQFNASNIGSYTLTFTATDEGGKSASTTTHLTIYNNAPVINVSDVSIGVDKQFSLDISSLVSNEENKATCQYSISLGGDNHGWINVSGSTLSGSTTIDSLGVTTVSVTVTDEVGQSSSGTFTITVYRTPRVVTPIQNLELNYLVPWSLDVTPHFDVNTGITWSASGTSGWLSFDPETATFSGTPSKADVGKTWNVTVTASESRGSYFNSTDASFAITVVDRQPVCLGFEDKSVSYTAGTFSYDISTCFNDPDVDAYSGLTWNVTLPGWLSWDNSTKIISGNLSHDVVGNYVITVVVTDEFGKTASGSFTVHVTNNPPFVVNQPSNVTLSYKDSTVLNLLNVFSDIENAAAVTVSCQVPAWMTWDSANSVLIIAPTAANVGQTTVNLVATDECGATVTSSFLVIVTNQAPNGMVPNQNVLANSDLTLNVSQYFSDPEGDALTYSFSGLPAWVSASGATLTGSPSSSQVGTTSVTVRATDVAGAIVTSTFSLTVYDTTNKPPEVYRALDDQITYEMSEWTYNITGYFIDPDDAQSTLSYTVTWSDSLGNSIDKPSWITWNSSTLAFTGLPPDGSAGTIYTATVKVTSQDGRHVSDSFNIIVYGMQVLPCGKYYKDTDFTGSKAGTGQSVTKKISLGSVSGSVTVSFDAYTYYDSFSLIYNGTAVSLTDPYDSVSRTVISVGRDNPSESYPAAASKVVTWQYPANHGTYVLLKIFQGPNSTDWRFKVSCPV